MKILQVPLTVIVLGIMSYGQVRHTGRHVVLPNPKLVRCISSDCYQLWQDKSPDVNDIYPEEVKVSLLGSTCPVGVAARYDKSVLFDDLQAAIEDRYGRGELKHWTKARLAVWNVASENVSIQLETADKRMAKVRGVAVGTKYVHYTTSLVPTNCNSQ